MRKGVHIALGSMRVTDPNAAHADMDNFSDPRQRFDSHDDQRRFRVTGSANEAPLLPDAKTRSVPSAPALERVSQKKNAVAPTSRMSIAGTLVMRSPLPNDTWTVPCNTHNPASRARISPSATEPRKLKTPAGTRACGSRGVPPGRY